MKSTTLSQYAKNARAHALRTRYLVEILPFAGCWNSGSFRFLHPRPHFSSPCLHKSQGRRCRVQLLSSSTMTQTPEVPKRALQFLRQISDFLRKSLLRNDAKEVLSCFDCYQAKHSATTVHGLRLMTNATVAASDTRSSFIMRSVTPQTLNPRRACPSPSPIATSNTSSTPTRP